jgi:hypothetical protein
MNDDVRDRMVQELLGAAAGGDEPPYERLLERVHRRGRMRRTTRWVALIAAVATFVGGVTWAGLTIGGHRNPIVPAEGGFTQVSDPVVGLSMQAPSSWHVQRFSNVCKIGATGVMVANIPDAYPGAETPYGCQWPPPMGQLPSTAVVAEFDHYFGGPALHGFGPGRDTRFPLSLQRLPRLDLLFPDQPGHYGVRVILRGDPRYQVNVWIGHEASAADLDRVTQVVASIEPDLCPAPEPGLYDPAVDPTSGRAGSAITVAGEVPTVDEAGDYTGPSGRIAVWWNADPAHYEDLLADGRLDDLLAGRTPAPGPGDAVFLGMQDVGGRCRYGLDLTVPSRAAPGTYDLTVIQAGDGGASALRGLRFTVTP